MRVDHVGSLLRPQSLIDAFLDCGRGKIGTSALEVQQDEAIREVVGKQEAAGLPVITDGEYRRLNWQVSFSRVDGWDQWENAWNAFVTNPMAMLRRIEDAQQYIDIGQLAISPQCGFASGIGGNFLSEQQQWQKLELMLEVAGKVWGS